MAETKTQNPMAEQQRGADRQRGPEQREVARRYETLPARDLFGMNPFTMMRRLSDEMDRAFASTFGLSRGMGEAGLWSPPIEVRERNHNLEIVAELPGMTKDDVKVEWTDEGLVIEGEKRREYETDEGGMHRSERSYGRFYRMIPLPEGTQSEHAKAEFKDGVLTVRVPAPEQHRKIRQIPINS